MQHKHNCILNSNVSFLLFVLVLIHISNIFPFTHTTEPMLEGNTNTNTKILFNKRLMTNTMVMFKDDSELRENKNGTRCVQFILALAL